MTPRASFWIWALLLSSGCGSRSALLDGAPRDGSGGGGGDSSAGGGGAPIDPCAPKTVTAACAGDIANAAAGSEVWHADFDLKGLSLIGPAAADADGGTYYLAAESSLYAKTVYALDACGALRWQADVSSLVAASGYVTRVMVAAGHLLIVGVGNIVALDIESGAHVWTADLDGFAKGGGLGVTPGKVVALGYAAARADGTVFTAVANDQDLFVVSVSPEAEMHPVGKVDHYLGFGGYPFNAQQLAIDAAGDVILAGGSSSSDGEPIRAFTAGGESVFSSTLPNGGLGQLLAAGPDYVTGRGLWILNLDGTLRSSFMGGGPTFVEWAGPTVIDESGALYVVGAQYEEGSSNATYNLLGGFTPGGDPLWSVTLDEPVVSGPVLDDQGRLFVITSAGFDAGSPMHLAAYGADGSLSWRTDLGPSAKLPSYWLLQSAAGALVLVIDQRVHAFSSGGGRPPSCAFWPTPSGDPGQRVCAREK